jgi:DNA-binding NtrC family response regulator
MTDSSIAGRCILIVEDEAFIALNLETILSEAGAEFVHAKTAAEAMTQLGKRQFDAAILDVHLADGSSYKVADELRRQGTPFVFQSGYLTIREGYADIPFLEKPFTAEGVKDAVAKVLGQAAA